MAGPFTYPVAQALPFDGSDALPPFTAENAKDGIIEARDNASGTAAGYVILSGKASNISNGYLEFFDSLSSDTNPFIFNVDNKLVGFSVSTKTSSICDYEIRIDGITIYTLSQNGLSANVGGLDITALAGAGLSVYVTNGTANRPLFNTFCKVG